MNEVEAVAPGDFADRVAAERETLVGFFRRRQGSAEAAEDFAHDSQLAALASDRDGRYREVGKGRGFLYAIARRVLAKSFRQSPWQVAKLGFGEEPAAEGNPETELALRERSRRLRDAVSRLPATLREPIEILLDEDLPMAAIALRLGSTEAAIKVRIHRAKLRLREDLECEMKTLPKQPGDRT